MKRLLLLVALVGILLVIYKVFVAQSVEAPAETDTPLNLPEVVDELPNELVPDEVAATIAAKADLIKLTKPQPLAEVTSPLTITGEARGYWFFEASFPVTLVNWDGLIIGSGIATAEGDWMTEDFVPFTATIEFENPYQTGQPDFMARGAIILQKDNPSGLPEHDDALEVPIRFAPVPAQQAPTATGAPVVIYDGISVPQHSSVVDLSGRGLTGSLKAEVRQLDAITELDLSDNEFTGLPAEVGQLTTLEVLNLSNNPLTGLPYELGNLSNLEVLDLRGTNYAAADLAIITQSLPSSTQILTD